MTAADSAQSEADGKHGGAVGDAEASGLTAADGSVGARSEAEAVEVGGGPRAGRTPPARGRPRRTAMETGATLAEVASAWCSLPQLRGDDRIVERPDGEPDTSSPRTEA